MRCLVYGGRDYRNRERLFYVLDALHENYGITAILHGDAQGADRLGKAWARSRGVLHIPFAARWDDIDVPGAVICYRRDGTAYNVLAGFQRNQKMADQRPEIAIECPGGKGTADMADRLEAAGIGPFVLDN
jgi:hypothetical protein